jgi:RNA polymerase sigma factor (sigma-70 family)
VDPLPCEFPSWIEQILPARRVVAYIRTRDLLKEAEDICSTLSTRLENARRPGKIITTGYAWVVLRNLAIDKYRKINAERKKGEKDRQKAKVADPPLDTGTPVVDKLIHAESEERAQKLVADAIDRLGLRQRVIIKLKVDPLHKFTFKEIGQIVGYSESSVRVEYKKIHIGIEKFVYDRLNTENNKFP